MKDTRMQHVRLRESPTLGLFRAPGRVFSIKSFALEHMGLLAAHEQAMLTASLGRFCDNTHIPPEASAVLTRSQWLSGGDRPAAQVVRRGARNAYWPKLNLLFKGCRPIQGPDTFPDESVPWGEDRVHFSRIPFGVLTDEGVMREILGHYFFEKHGLPLRSKPLCVYQYETQGRTLGHCLVLETVIEDRIESFIEYPKMTLSDLILNDVVREKTGIAGVFRGEVPLRHVNGRAYAEAKAHMLALMNRNGGFRGLLNSNIGNDVVEMGAGSSRQFFLCDFDTFHVVRIPRRPDRAFKRAFLMQCLVEVVKGSLPVIDYLHAKHGQSPAALWPLAREVFFSRSSLWQAYARRWNNVATAVQCGTRMANELAAEIYNTPAFMATLMDQVPNYVTLKQSPPLAESMYTPHD
jgi:hypothetical protein